jgi:hypothetical protein
MTFFKRRRFLIYSIICFFGLIPFLVLYSLGYNINFNDRSIENSINIRIETIPFSTNINVNEKLATNITPTDIRITSNGQENINLNISKEDYQEEKFTISGVDKKNTSVKITSLYLLNKKGNVLDSFNSENKSKISFFGENIIYFDSISQDFKYRPINLNGETSDEEFIKINKINPKFELLFEEISTNIFFDYQNKLLIFNDSNGKFNIIDFNNSWISKNNLEFKLDSLALNSLISYENDIIFTNQNHVLYQFNLESNRLYQIDTGVYALSKTKKPEQIWLLDKTGVNEVVDRIFDSEGNLSLLKLSQIDQVYNEKEIIQNNCVELEYCKFKIDNVLAGSVFQINEKFYYLESQKLKLYKINNKTKKFIVAKDMVFIIDSENNIYTFNLFNKQILFLDSLNNTDDINNLLYIEDWKRLFVFQNKYVSSIWYDNDTINNKIIKYNIQTWSENSCYNQLFDRILVCKKDDNSIVYYQNNRLI